MEYFEGSPRMEIYELIKKITEEVLTQLDDSKSSQASVVACEYPPESLAKYIDHTILKAEASEEDIRKTCEEARKHQFASVCVNPGNIKLVADLLAGSGVAPCVVVGFPLGATAPEIIAEETRAVLSLGAKEVDMVVNIGAIKSNNWQLVKRGIEAVVEAAKGRGLVKVIIETCLLTDEEKVKACTIAKMAGADFVKTSTGFSKSGATVEDVKLMRQTVGPHIGVKASGGVRDYATAVSMIKAGASRLGTSSGVAIVTGGGLACLDCGQCATGNCPIGNVSVIKDTY